MKFKLDHTGSLRSVSEQYASPQHVAVRLNDIFEIVDSLDVFTEEHRDKLKKQFLDKAFDIGVI